MPVRALALGSLVLATVSATFSATLAQEAAATSDSAPRIARILLPAGSGPYHVAVARQSLADPSRTDTISGTPDRRLVITAWYPAADSAGGARRRYMDGPTAEALSNSQGIPAGFADLVVGHALADARPHASPGEGFPILLFSHGLAWPAAYYQVILTDLASRGFIVIAVEHLHGADPIVTPEGDVVPWGLFTGHEAGIPDEALWGYLPTWRDDLLFVLSRLASGRGLSPTLGEIAALADFGRAGVFGHSYGGTAAILAAEASGRLRGAVNLEGAMYGETRPYPVSTPTLYVLGGVNADHLEGTQFRQGSTGARYFEAVVEGATHGTFSDLLILYRSFSEGMGPEGRILPTRGALVTSDLVAGFFGGLFDDVEAETLAARLRAADVRLVR